MIKHIRKYRVAISVFLTLNFLFPIAFTNSAYAITGHNSMPEYRSFEPVATTNMVNLFDGSFTYNIPLLEVPNGYPINLSYHSGDVNNESQSSWVGLGWTLNPGAINRAKQGFPDDFNAIPVTYHSRMPKNWTVSGDYGVNLEILSAKIGGDPQALLNAGASVGLSYNNYKGVTTSLNFGLSGMASLDFEFANGKFGWDANVNPGFLVSKIVTAQMNKKQKSSTDQDQKEEEPVADQGGKEKEVTKSGMIKNLSKSEGASQIAFTSQGYGGLAGSVYSSLMPSRATPYPMSVTPFTGTGVRFSLNVGVHTVPIQLSPQASISGSYVQQVYEDQQTPNVFGYMYNENALTDATNSQTDPAYNIMDYSMENEKMFEKREKMIGMPNANVDNFSLSGEALGGSFRLYRSEYGHYRKDYAENVTSTFSGGVDMDYPNPITVEFTLGANLGYDRNELQISGWDYGKLDEGNDYTFASASNFSSNENTFFAFAGDKAADFGLSPQSQDGVAYGADVIPGSLTIPTNIDDALSIGDAFRATLDIDESRFSQKIDQRVARGSYIGSSKIVDFDAMANGVRYKVYERNLKVYNASNTLQNFTYTPYNDETLGEIYSFNADGIGYVYGLPLFTRNEKQISYELGSSSIYPDATGLIATVPTSTGLDTESKRKIGYEADTPYATQFLLTQIVSPDYVDVSFDGPTTDDFGDYTKINYRAFSGPQSGSDWYSYKTPYSGLSYDYGTLSSNRDDMGSMQYGEKELYYVHSICSKTHAAIFYTSDRADGAEINVTSGASLDQICEATGYGINKLQKLDSIKLYSLHDLSATLVPSSGAQPIKTVRFEYDYHLTQSLPNNNGSSYDGDADGSSDDNQGGKLTLKKIWFEYQGKKTAKISPYVFNYTYPTEAASPYPTEYETFQDEYGDNSNLSASQNPDYSQLNSDAWGAYRDFSGDHQSNFGTDLARFFPYVNQKPVATYDPAAWHLKNIELPSGGEIHVQYEQHDYNYVQDKEAMIMVPLDDTNTPHDDEGDLSKKYYLDVDKILRDETYAGLSNQERKALADKLFEPFYETPRETNSLSKGERLYFNFLYTLVGDNVPDYTTVNAEYIDGYARIHGFGYNSNGIYFTFKSNAQDTVAGASYYNTIDYGDASFSKKEFPRKVCDNFYSTQRKGMVDGSANNLDPDGEKPELLAAVLNVFSQVAGYNICAAMDPGMSFVRLRSPQDKLGGGVRVKRLLMYDEGITTNDTPVLYGQEYDYDINGRSSGVATNEPPAARRESPLVNPIDKDSKSRFREILWGRDMYSQEAPLAESMLPGPSVGYRHVKVSNIHSGKTSTGYEVHKFHTCKEHPMQVDMSTLKQEQESKIDINLLLLSYYRKTPYLSQGFSVVTNEMHGKPLSVAKYAQGVDQGNPTAMQIYEYFEPDDQVPVMGEDFGVEYVNMGRKNEVYSEHKQISDYSTGISTTLDFSGGVVLAVIPIPMTYASATPPAVYYRESVYHTHSTTKVTHYPATIKRIINKADGVTHITENKVFDRYTGEPLVVTSYDDFNQKLTNQSFPAHGIYPAMGPKSLNENSTFTDLQVSLNSGNLLVTLDACEGSNSFTKGDLVEVQQGGNFGLYHVEQMVWVDASQKRLTLTPSGITTSSITAGAINLTVLKSGKTNQMNAQAGKLLSLSSIQTPQFNAEVERMVDSLNFRLDNCYSGQCTDLVVGNDPNFTCSFCDYRMFDLDVTEDGCAIDSASITTWRMNFYFHSSIEFDVRNCYSGDPPTNIGSHFDVLEHPGQFQFNYFSNTLEFKSEDNCIIPLNCLEFCVNFSYDSIITASATTFSDDWGYDAGDYRVDITGLNDYESGKRGKWRPESQYVFRNGISADKNFNSGLFTLNQFNWDDLSANDPEKWVLTSTTTAYSPNGNPVEDKNILDIYSTAQYGYDFTLPTAVAQNAQNGSVNYESFERTYTFNTQDQFENGLAYNSSDGTHTSAEAHTGDYSIKMKPGTAFDVGAVTTNAQVISEGLSVRAWLKADKSTPLLDGKVMLHFGSQSMKMAKVSSAGEWSLFEANVIDGLTLDASETFSISVDVNYYSEGDVYLDDVRMQPMLSEMVCYVYDPVQRLTAVFDDQHFAMIYEYNAKGELVRKLKETKEGVKTISETQYNVVGQQTW